MARHRDQVLETFQGSTLILFRSFEEVSFPKVGISWGKKQKRGIRQAVLVEVQGQSAAKDPR